MRSRRPGGFARRNEIGAAMNNLPQNVSPEPMSHLHEAVKKTASFWAQVDRSLKKCAVAKGKEQSVDPWLARRVLEKLRSSVPEALSDRLLEEVSEWLASLQHKAVTRFEEQFVAFASDQSLHLAGHFPSYIVNHHLAVRVSEREGTTHIGTKVLRTIMPESVLAEVVAILTVDQKRGFKPSVFIEQLYTAYERATFIGKMSQASAPVPVPDVYRELVVVLQSKRFFASPSSATVTEYSRDMFARDLARLVASGSTGTASGRRLHLNPTSQTKDALPIILEGGLRFVGRIAFA